MPSGEHGKKSENYVSGLICLPLVADTNMISTTSVRWSSAPQLKMLQQLS